MCEIEFDYEPHLEGLPDTLTCYADCVSSDASFIAHNRAGVVQEYPRKSWEVKYLRVYAGSVRIDPEQVEPGLAEDIKEAALARVAE